MLNNSYNERAVYWRDVGLEKFQSGSFYINSSISTDHFRTISRSGTNLYPVQDTCDKKGDPDEGCLYVDSTWFDSTVVIYESEAKYSIFNSNLSEIASFVYPSTIQFLMTPKELGCTYQM